MKHLKRTASLGGDPGQKRKGKAGAPRRSALPCPPGWRSGRPAPAASAHSRRPRALHRKPPALRQSASSNCPPPRANAPRDHMCHAQDPLRQDRHFPRESNSAGFGNGASPSAVNGPAIPLWLAGGTPVPADRSWEATGPRGLGRPNHRQRAPGATWSQSTALGRVRDGPVGPAWHCPREAADPRGHRKEARESVGPAAFLPLLIPCGHSGMG